MRLLLDENLPRKVVRLLAPEAEAVTVEQRGWDGKTNGELLALAHDEFDAFLTMDKGIEHQQNIAELDLIVVLVRARSNAIEDIAPLVDGIKVVLTSSRPGTVVRVPEDLA